MTTAKHPRPSVPTPVNALPRGWLHNHLLEQLPVCHRAGAAHVPCPLYPPNFCGSLEMQELHPSIKPKSKSRRIDASMEDSGSLRTSKRTDAEVRQTQTAVNADSLRMLCFPQKCSGLEMSLFLRASGVCPACVSLSDPYSPSRGYVLIALASG